MSHTLNMQKLFKKKKKGKTSGNNAAELPEMLAAWYNTHLQFLFKF